MTVIVNFVPESNTERYPFRKWPNLNVRHIVNEYEANRDDEFSFF